MKNMENSINRENIIKEMLKIIQNDCPWIWGFHPKSFSLSHKWLKNVESNLMANNRLKYTRIVPEIRDEKRQLWNQAVFWPLFLALAVFLLLLFPAVNAFKRRAKETMQ